MRHLPFVTIDGEDAKDFDDAVFCQRLPEKANAVGGLSSQSLMSRQYVKPEMPLDTEAKIRGNSVYFPNKVLPMLPESLSNGLCSLKPNVDRLVLVCEMDIDPQGEVIDYKFYEAVIHSQARASLTPKWLICLKTQNRLPEYYFRISKNFMSFIKKLSDNVNCAAQWNLIPLETKIVFGSQGKIERIVPLQRNAAHRMIEEAMLLANVCAAHFLMNKDHRLYIECMKALNLSVYWLCAIFYALLIYDLSGGKKPSPKDYAKLIRTD